MIDSIFDRIPKRRQDIKIPTAGKDGVGSFLVRSMYQFASTNQVNALEPCLSLFSKCSDCCSGEIAMNKISEYVSPVTLELNGKKIAERRQNK
jgi:hypothetical protein